MVVVLTSGPIDPLTLLTPLATLGPLASLARYLIDPVDPIGPIGSLPPLAPLASYWAPWTAASGGLGHGLSPDRCSAVSGGVPKSYLPFLLGLRLGVSVLTYDMNLGVVCKYLVSE